MAGLSTIPSAGDRIIERNLHARDHSWKDFIGDTEGDESVSSSFREAIGIGPCISSLPSFFLPTPNTRLVKQLKKKVKNK